MVCPNCGTNNPIDATFCSNCGGPLTVTPPKKINIWMIIVPILVITFVLIVTLSGSNEKYIGKWKCKGYSATAGPSGDYMITMILKSNGEYTFGEYNDLDNNHSKGTFTAKYEDKKKETTGKDFYQLDFKNEEFIVKGVKQTGNYTMNLEMELIKRNEALIVNSKNYAMYYCYK
jgi:predicted nucleic acid-binding Zn ribbon protein